MKVMQSVYNCQGTHKKLGIVHEFELYKFELDKFGGILKRLNMTQYTEINTQ